MKAAQVKNYGGAETIEIVTDAPQPELKAGQVLVEVRAAGLNRIDSAIRNGYLQQMLPLTFPLTVGGDFVGVVTQVSEGTTDFKEGDEVYGNAGQLKGGSGGLAEYTAANNSTIGFKPKSLDYTQSAAVPLVGTSALQGIEEELQVKSGQKVLIQGGGGGVGAVAVQIAKLQGAYVAATVGTDDIDLVKGLGADEVIDYKTQDVTQLLKDYDAVFDTAGGEGVNKLFTVLKKGGKLVTLAGQPDQELAKQHEVTATNQMTTVSTAQLTRLAELIDTNKVRVPVEKVFQFEQVKEAFTYFETQHPKGKIVVTVK